MRWPADTSRRALAVLAAAAGACSAPPEEPRSAAGTFRAGEATVFVDGAFDEWAGVAALVEDPAEAPTAAVDLGTVHALDDPGWLYLAFEVGHVVNAQSLPGTLALLVDADNDPTSGADVDGMEGVDLVLELSHRDEPGSGARGLGFALRPVDEQGPRSPSASDPLDVVVAPTWSADRFELRLGRAGSTESALPALGERVRLKLLYREATDVVDEVAPVEYAFSTEPARPVRAAMPAGRLAREAGTLRVAQLNVSSGSFDRSRGDFARLLAAVEPDVLLLDELPGGTSPSELERFFDAAPLRALGSWRFVLGESGGRQHAAVATREEPLRPAPHLRDVRYPAGSIESLTDSVPAAFRRALQQEARIGVPAAGAWIDVGPRPVLFVALDFRSRGWHGSPEDRVRALQARTVRARIDEELASRAADLVVVGGDLNLVGSRTPLTILSGPDVGLHPVRAERLGERTLSTWRNPGAPFAPGRLDFILVPSNGVEVADAFVFTTEDLASEALEVLALEATLSGELSDHLVVVADLHFR